MSCETTEAFNSKNLSSAVWFSLRDKKYDPFYSPAVLDDLEIDNASLDIDNYTYIVVMGYTAKSLHFSFTEMKNRNKYLLPKQFVGILELGEEKPGEIFIYRIKKMNIDSDIHDIGRSIIGWSGSQPEDISAQAAYN